MGGVDEVVCERVVHIVVLGEVLHVENVVLLAHQVVH